MSKEKIQKWNKEHEEWLCKRCCVAIPYSGEIKMTHCNIPMVKKSGDKEYMDRMLEIEKKQGEFHD